MLIIFDGPSPELSVRIFIKDNYLTITFTPSIKHKSESNTKKAIELGVKFYAESDFYFPKDLLVPNDVLVTYNDYDVDSESESDSDDEMIDFTIKRFLNPTLDIDHEGYHLIYQFKDKVAAHVVKILFDHLEKLPKLDLFIDKTDFKSMKEIYYPYFPSLDTKTSVSEQKKITHDQKNKPAENKFFKPNDTNNKSEPVAIPSLKPRG